MAQLLNNFDVADARVGQVEAVRGDRDLGRKSQDGRGHRRNSGKLGFVDQLHVSPDAHCWRRLQGQRLRHR